MSEEKIRKCRSCNDRLPEGSRANREFCPKKFGIKDHCKNKFNNPKTLMKYHLNKDLMKINTVNRSILKSLLGSLSEREVSLQQPLDAGFRLGYVINRAEMNQSKNPVLLYIDFGLEQLGENNYKIFRHGRKF